MKEPNKFHNYETEKITRKASDLSLHFNGHFIEAKVMEVVVTTGAIRVQSSSQIITTNKPTTSFYRPDALPVAQPTVTKH